MLGGNSQEKDQYIFKKKHSLDFTSSKLFMDQLAISSVEELEEIMKSSKIIIHLESNGTVTITYNQHEETSCDVEVFGSIFHADGKVSDFKQMVSFNDDAKDDIFNIIDKEHKRLLTLYEIEKRNQNRLPKNFQDPRQLKKYEAKLNNL